MKRKFKVAGLLLAGLLIVCVALTLLFPAKAKSLILPEVKKINGVFITIKQDTAFIRVNISIRNKTFISFTTDSVKLKAGIAGKTLLEDQQPAHLDLNAYEEDTVGFTIELPYKSVLAELRNKRKMHDSADFFVTITPVVRTPIGRKSFPIHKSAQFKIPTPPEISIDEINYTDLGLKNIKAEITVKIANPNDVYVGIKNIKYSLNVPGRGNINGHLEKLIKVKPKGETTVNLPVNLEVKNMLKTVADALLGKDEFPYSLSLSAVIDTNKIFREPTRVQVSKKGTMHLKKAIRANKKNQ